MTVWWARRRWRNDRRCSTHPSVRSRLSEPERTQAIASPSLSSLSVRTALLEVLFASGADLLILPIQDVFGWSDRINQPATVE